MIEVFRADDDESVGTISNEDLDFLVEHLVEEDIEDTDYYVDRDTIDYLKTQGASAAALAVLERALGDRDGVELYYFPEDAEPAAEADEGEVA